MLHLGDENMNKGQQQQVWIPPGRGVMMTPVNFFKIISKPLKTYSFRTLWIFSFYLLQNLWPNFRLLACVLHLMLSWKMVVRESKFYTEVFVGITWISNDYKSHSRNNMYLELLTSPTIFQKKNHTYLINVFPVSR